MNIEEFYQEIQNMLPIKRKDEFKDMDYRDIVHHSFKHLNFIINNIELASQWSGTVFEKSKKIIGIYCESIEDIINSYYMGLISYSYQKFARLIFEENYFAPPLYKYLYYAIPVNPYTNEYPFFYRIRSSEHYRDFTYKDMFHIPLNQRGIIKTQRFSIIGYPCLYLGRSIYGCWEEMHRPSLDSFVVSQYNQVKGNLRLWDLRVPTINDNILKDEGLFCNMICKLPLIISCMVESKYETTQIYKPEYIIPQLLMELIISYIQNGIYDIDSDFQKERDCVYGIYYTSVQKNNIFFKDTKSLFDNVAIPVVETNETIDYCPVLSKLFEISDPTSEEIERIKNLDTGVPANTNRLYYELSIFGMLERRLKNAPAHKIIPQYKEEYSVNVPKK